MPKSNQLKLLAIKTILLRLLLGVFWPRFYSILIVFENKILNLLLLLQWLKNAAANKALKTTLQQRLGLQ